MVLPPASLMLAATLVAHPLDVSGMAALSRSIAAEPEPDPSWDEPDAEDVPPAEPATPPEPASEAAPPPAAQPTAPVPQPAPAAAVPAQQVLVLRPEPNKGTGLIIAASITGGLAWGTAIGRMVTMRNCIDAIETGDIEASAIDCSFRTGPALLLLTPTGWLLNWATWGLATGAGVVRGKYDGVNAAWDGAPQRNSIAFIASGATLLGLGVVGRVATLATFSRTIEACGVSADDCRDAALGHFFGVQLSSASIALGAGLLAYGLAFQGNKRRETNKLKKAGIRTSMRFAPQVGFNFTGLSLSGRF